MKKAGFLTLTLSILSLLFTAAPAANALCYADSSREAGMYIEEQTDVPEISEEEMYLVQQAFAAGLQTLDAHTYTDSLTEQDKEILKLLDETIPAIINKVQSSISEVEEELTKANETLARKVIANQNLYPAPTNWEIATMFASTTSLMHAMMSGKIDERVAEILMEESMSALENMFDDSMFEE